MTATQRRVLASIITHHGQHISYDDLAAEVSIERRTVITAVRCLAKSGVISVRRGGGTIANSYSVQTISPRCESMQLR